jgi:copper chaperone CopZ
MNRIGFLLVVISVAAVFGAAAAFSPSGDKASAVAELQVGNLTCGACVEKIRAAVLSLDGSARVGVDLAAGRARVIYDSSRTDAAALAGQISRAGFPTVVSPVSTGPGAPTTTDGIRCPGLQPVKKAGCGGGCCG